MFKGEKVFEGEKLVKYYYQKSYKKTNNLVIVFSGFPSKGKRPMYNYIRTLAEFDCNKLFILDDFGGRASYYLCENQNFTIENSIISLINFIIKENDIKTVLTCGSSKGGYAALYYGIKYGFNHIVAASPQYFLGDYLLKQTNSSDVVNFMSGSSNEQNHEFLNTIMSKMIDETKNRPNIFIHLGKGESHYENHVKPLLSKLEEAHIEYDLDLGDYSKHSDVGRFFPTLLKNKIRDVFHYPYLEIIQSHEDIHPVGTECVFKANTESNSNKVAWYLYHDNNRIDTKNYSLDKTYSINFLEKGTYYVKAFVLNNLNNKVSVNSNIIEII